MVTAPRKLDQIREPESTPSVKTVVYAENNPNRPLLHLRMTEDKLTLNKHPMEKQKQQQDPVTEIQRNLFSLDQLPEGIIRQLLEIKGDTFTQREQMQIKELDTTIEILSDEPFIPKEYVEIWKEVRALISKIPTYSASSLETGQIIQFFKTWEAVRRRYDRLDNTTEELLNEMSTLSGIEEISSLVKALVGKEIMGARADEIVFSLIEDDNKRRERKIIKSQVGHSNHSQAHHNPSQKIEGKKDQGPRLIKIWGAVR